jgi:putative ABC transport system permease protein
LTAVLAPLLILFGLKSGIVYTLTQRLVQDPRNLEVIPMGSSRLTDEWFRRLKKQAGVAFVVPRTRQIAATVDLRNPHMPLGVRVSVELIPTEKGDPLLARWRIEPRGGTSLVLTQSAAEKLGARSGDEVIASIGRTSGGNPERVHLSLTVTAVLPLAAFQRDAAFASLRLLEAAEDYRDGYAVAAFGWPGVSAPPGPRIYPSFRLYAQSMEDVLGLRDHLLAMGLDTYTQAEQIETIRVLDRNLSTIFYVIATVAVFGYTASLGASSIAAVERKRRELGVLRLLGFSTWGMVLFPVSEALFTAVFGIGLATVAYWITQVGINYLFADSLSAGEAACRLLPVHLAGAIAMTLICVLAAAAFGGWRAARVEPAESLRDI